ncbi:TetR/AcrR family transcriptional regulator [Amycolatopsis endophytica]|uniref:AcrR family transcriptional regulator n=1 Tax=Amycolatopsis endophytica TaxID=860233 RepID=A0A853AWR9_9PSEU|nr:TetR/AcrR family transcriptional regulator [Amycolatopsis endophytica]NYI87046.1 AcrR family transcriptional regulator [Amycolatopsis endophytica]
MSRRHGEELESAILQAAWDELVEVGYAKLTMESVAVRAGTSKPVIYRRWPGRAELVLAAWRRRVPREGDLPDTGNLRADLLTLLERTLHRFDDTPRDVLAGLMTETFRDPEVFALLLKQIAAATHRPSIETIVGRAVERGEIRPVELTARAARLPLDLIRVEAAFYHREITEKTITEIVDDVFLPLLRGLAR